MFCPRLSMKPIREEKLLQARGPLVNRSKLLFVTSKNYYPFRWVQLHLQAAILQLDTPKFTAPRLNDGKAGIPPVRMRCRWFVWALPLMRYRSLKVMHISVPTEAIYLGKYGISMYDWQGSGECVLICPGSCVKLNATRLMSYFAVHGTVDKRVWGSLVIVPR